MGEASRRCEAAGVARNAIARYSAEGFVVAPAGGDVGLDTKQHSHGSIASHQQVEFLQWYDLRHVSHPIRSG